MRRGAPWSGLLPALLCALLLHPSVTMAGDPGGGSSDSDEGSYSVYIALGAGLIIAGLLFLDVLGDSGDEDVADGGAGTAITPTGIDWDAALDAASAELPRVAVTASSPSLSGTASQVLAMIAALGTVDPYPEPIELGGMQGGEAYGAASAFFGAEWLVVVSESGDSARIDLLGPGSSAGHWLAGPVAGYGAAAAGIEEYILSGN